MSSVFILLHCTPYLENDFTATRQNHNSKCPLELHKLNLYQVIAKKTTKIQWRSALLQRDAVNESSICPLYTVYLTLQQGSPHPRAASLTHVELAINVLETAILDVKVVTYGADYDQDGCRDEELTKLKYKENIVIYFFVEIFLLQNYVIYRYKIVHMHEDIL